MLSVAMVAVVGGMVRGCAGQALGLSVEKSGAFSVSHTHIYIIDAM